MNCERYEDWLGDAVDGTLDPGREAELDAHCRTCTACRELLGDLKEIRSAAAALDRITPSPAVWNAIAAKVGAVQAPAAARSSTGAGAWGWNAALAAAAALVLLVGAAVGVNLLQNRTPPAGAPDAIARAASELQMAEQHYLNAIATLEQLAAQKDNALEPDVAAEIAASLRSIDTAISDSRAALKTDPDSFVAQTSLLEALRMKVALLQDTVSLMNARS